MSSEYTEIHHGKILSILKSNSKILGLVYNGEEQSNWSRESIEKAISSATDIRLNYSDDLLIMKLKDFFNVDIQMETNQL